jgi:hypothetical protein
MTEPGEWNDRLRESKKRKYDDTDSYRSPLPPNMNPAFADLINSKAEDIRDTVNIYRTDPGFAQYFAEDASVKDADAYYERARANRPQYKTAHAGSGGPKDISQAAVDRGFTQIRTDLGLENPTNSATGKKLTTVGMWQPSVVVAQPAEKDATYDLALLNLISQVFLNYVKSVEIEVMCLADRVVVSANNIGDIPELQNRAIAASIEGSPTTIKTKGDKIEQLYQWQMSKHTAIRELRSDLRKGQDPGNQVLDIVTAANMFPESYESTVAALKVIAADTIKNVKTTTSGLGPYLTDPAFVSAYIIIEPIDHSHAEQNLMLALINSNYSTGADISIAGGKRPCTICYLSLCLTKEKYPSLRYGIKPGGMYMGETKKGLTEICAALGIGEKLLLDKARYYLDKTNFQQYLTAYKDVDEAALAQAIARKDNVVTVQHIKAASDIASTQQVPREHTIILEGLEGAGLSSKQPEVGLRPNFDRSSFGAFSPNETQEERDDMDFTDSQALEADETDQEVATAENWASSTHVIATTEELDELLAKATEDNWPYVRITNKDPMSQLLISGGHETPVHLRSGANVVATDGRMVVIDDDNVSVQLIGAHLRMDEYHQAIINVETDGSAIVLAKAGTKIVVVNGLLSVKGEDASGPAQVELHSGTVDAYENTVITKVGTDEATIEVLARQVTIGGSRDGLEVHNNNFTPTLL